MLTGLFARRYGIFIGAGTEILAGSVLTGLPISGAGDDTYRHYVVA